MPSSPLVVALSGLSSIGKSTIASHLPTIFPPPFYDLTILHVDDFYKPQTELPHRGGLLDWDCAQSLDWPRLEDAVRGWRRDGVHIITAGSANPQPQFQQEDDDDDDNATAVAGDEETKGSRENGITLALVEQLRAEGAPDPPGSAASGRQRILILDGFLLFTPSVPAAFRSLLDLKILLRAPYADAKGRRESRKGYVTMEGWWEDPPGYFDTVVWPNYVEENRGFFVDGDVQGRIDDTLCDKEGVKVWVGETDGLAKALTWVSGEMTRIVEENNRF
ncbi:MAG: hypothetical protein L6R36_007384 [Xanthoria steineri]|nr:MAG: hypothetical protein L6R36_007384 [Xanthoria steineri]